MVFEETQKIILAQKCRGVNLNNSSIKGIKLLVKSVIPPVFVHCFRSANEVAMAIECKCFGFTDQRTSIYEPKFKKEDIFSLIFVIFIILGVVVCQTKMKF